MFQEIWVAKYPWSEQNLEGDEIFDRARYGALFAPQKKKTNSVDLPSIKVKRAFVVKRCK